jgi:hypothetical protein
VRAVRKTKRFVQTTVTLSEAGVEWRLHPSSRIRRAEGESEGISKVLILREPPVERRRPTLSLLLPTTANSSTNGTERNTALPSRTKESEDS